MSAVLHRKRAVTLPTPACRNAFFDFDFLWDRHRSNSCAVCKSVWSWKSDLVAPTLTISWVARKAWRLDSKRVSWIPTWRFVEPLSLNRTRLLGASDTTTLLGRCCDSAGSMTWRRLTARAWGDSVKLELKIHAALPFDATLSLTMTLSLVGVLACVVWVPTKAGSRCWPIRSFHSRHPDRNAVRKAARMRLRRDQHPVAAPNSHLSATLHIARVAGAELNTNASGSPRSSARPSLHPHAALPRPRLDKSAEIKVVRAFQTPEPGSPPVRHAHQSCPDDLLPLFARYMLVICPTGGRLERERARASTQASLCSLVFNTNTDQPRRLPITLVQTGLTLGAEDEMRSHNVEAWHFSTNSQAGIGGRLT